MSNPHLEAISWCCDEHRQKRANEWIAHRAVVRELAETLEESDEPGQAQEEECARWRARKEAALAHPLVVAARKGDE